MTSHDGVELAVRDYGDDGLDVLLLHGATRNLEDWGPVLAHLGGVRAVSMDQRFHGHSSVGPSSSPSDWVRDIEAVVDGLGLSNPYVVGWSMGGINALLYGLQHPECPGVLNIDGYDTRQPELYEELSPERVREFLEAFETHSASFVPQQDEGDYEWHEQQIAIFSQMDALWGVDSDVTRAVVGRAFVQTAEGRWARRPPQAFWGTGIWDGGAVDVLDLLRRSRCPVTMLVCTKQQASPIPTRAAEFFEAGKRGLLRHLRAIAAEQPTLRIETIDATHGVIHERPADIANLVRSLVSA